MTLWFTALSFAAVLAYALLAGAFMIFSDFIMRSLARTAHPGGIEAMQHINTDVYRTVFMSLFVTMVPVSIVLIWFGMAHGAPLLTIAGLTYLIGGFGITAAGNVPMNTRLGALDHASEEAHTYWAGTYVPRWSLFNSARALACLSAAALTMLSLITA